MTALIERRVWAGKVNTIPEKARRKRATKAASNVVDLVSLLKQSLEKDKEAEALKKERRTTRKASSQSRARHKKSA